jgi:hypothetical protein
VRGARICDPQQRHHSTAFESTKHFVIETACGSQSRAPSALLKYTKKPADKGGLKFSA